jgi:type IX secretion system PorP/SprF family membrane protein
MKKIMSFILIFWSFFALSQQMPQFSQFNRNQFIVNPGAAGVLNYTDISLAGRWQWGGVNDGPKTTYLAFSMPVKVKTRYYNPGIRTSTGPIKNPKIETGRLKHTIGGQLVADQYGAFRKLAFSGTYALHLPMNKNFNLSFGLKVGLSNNTFLSDKAQVLNIIDNSQTYTDNTYTNYTSNQSNKYILDLGAGLYFYGKGFYVGLSSQQLTKDFVEFGKGTANFSPQIHYNLISGYRFKLNDELTLIPNVLMKYMYPAPLSIDVNLQAEYKDRVWFGLGYRHTDALIALFGINVNNRFRMGYSFDFSLSRFKNYSSGGHELVLGLMLGK